ncbi:MAG TPA: hypothetical protein VMK12_05930 [Anaeromyxobacteraceae bacterium]|nr:hypothetical protein [Anaeromyxobacteraceae bacterium]
MSPHGAGGALFCDALHGTGEDADAILQQRGVRWIVDVALHHRGVGAKLDSSRGAFLQRLLHDAVVDPLSRSMAENREVAAQSRVVGDRVLVEPGKVAVDKAVPQFALELSKRPVLQVLESAATQEPVRMA